MTPRATTSRISKTRLAAMIAEATVDCHDESDEINSWFTVLDEHVEVPFETTVLGSRVEVVRLDLRDGGRITAICTRGQVRQAISLADLPLPSPRPCGAEWIEAYQHWLSNR